MATNKDDTLITVSVKTRDEIKKIAKVEERTMKWVIEEAIKEFIEGRGSNG